MRARFLTSLLATLALSLAALTARADSPILPPANGYGVIVVLNCGDAQFTAGTWRPPTQDVTGKTCASGAGGGGGASADQSGTNASDAQQTTANNQHTLAFNYLFNGATFDRWRGVNGVGSVFTPDRPGVGSLDASSTSSKIDVDLNDTATVGLTFGTFPAGSAVTFYTSNDGGLTYSVKSTTNCARPQDASSTYSTSNGQPRIDVSGATYLRVVISSTGSGTIPVSYNRSAAPLACPNEQAVNNLKWAGALVGAPTVFGTAPTGAVVPGTNAYVTNFPATQAVTWANQTVAATQSGAWSVSVANFPATQAVNQTQINGVAVAVGAGASNTGTQRTVLASDSTIANGGFAAYPPPVASRVVTKTAVSAGANTTVCPAPATTLQAVEIQPSVAGIGLGLSGQTLTTSAYGTAAGNPDLLLNSAGMVYAPPSPPTTAVTAYSANAGVVICIQTAR